MLLIARVVASLGLPICGAKNIGILTGSETSNVTRSVIRGDGH